MRCRLFISRDIRKLLTLYTYPAAFGTYPKPVQDAMRRFQEIAEEQPDDFIRYRYGSMLKESRTCLSALLHAPESTLVFVPNATTGINTVFRNLNYTENDYIVYFSTTYGACCKTIDYITESTPAKSAVIDVTYPISDADLLSRFHETVSHIRSHGKQVKLALFDTVASCPGVRVPFEALTVACRELGILSCIDGAHGVGHMPLNLTELDPDFFVSNCHKWLFTPRGSAIFYVPLRNQHLIRSSIPISHHFEPLPTEDTPPRFNPFPPSDNSVFERQFEYTGALDNAPYLCVPAALEFRNSVCGGEENIMLYCHDLAQSGGRSMADILGTEIMENEAGSLGRCCMVNVRLPLSIDFDAAEKAVVILFMERRMIEDWCTWMFVFWYNGGLWCRLSA